MPHIALAAHSIGRSPCGWSPRHQNLGHGRMDRLRQHSTDSSKAVILANIWSQESLRLCCCYKQTGDQIHERARLELMVQMSIQRSWVCLWDTIEHTGKANLIYLVLDTCQMLFRVIHLLHFTQFLTNPRATSIIFPFQDEDVRDP